MATKKKATVSKASPKKTPSGQASKSSSVKAAGAKKTAPKKAQKAAGKKAVVKAAPEKAPKATVAPKAKAKPASKTKVAPKATPAPKASGATKPKSTPKPKPTKAPPASVARALAELDDDLDVDELHHEEVEEASRDKSDGPLRAYEPPKAPPRPLSAQAAAIIASDAPLPLVQEQGALMLGSSVTSAVQAARVLHELVDHKPELVVSLAEKFARGLTSKHKRVVQASADALPAIARIAPAKVARHLELLKSSYEPAILDGRDGLVRTFAALCTASVAYQKRLEPSLTTALERADGKTLLRWSRIVLPALKGEPHARARGVVEARLYRIPRAIAQQIADFLKIKLRVRY